MRTIIAGVRDFDGVEFSDYSIVCRAVEDSGFVISEVLSGGARGVDKLGEKWAKENGIEPEIWAADWDSYGKAAGPMRNRNMAENAEALIAIWDGKSRGTGNMIEEAKIRNLKVHIHYIGV